LRSVTIARVVGIACLLPLQGMMMNPRIKAIIQQNVNASSNAYKQLVTPQAQSAQLWIQVRNESQKKLIEGKLGWLKDLTWQGHPIDIRPLEVVGDGPSVSQLRYFKPEDRATVASLQASLAKGLPGIQVRDMSDAFRNVSWLRPGHFELWVAPGVTQFGPRH
jgi:hypothetical protein